MSQMAFKSYARHTKYFYKFITETLKRNSKLIIITGRNEAVAKVIFLHLFVILFTGGVSSRENRPPAERTPCPHQGDPPGKESPPARRNPPGKETPRQGEPLPGKENPTGRENPPPIRSMSGRYASYWNAFLLLNVGCAVISDFQNCQHHLVLKSCKGNHIWSQKKVCLE